MSEKCWVGLGKQRVHIGTGGRILATYWYSSIFSGGQNCCLYVCCLFQSQEVFKKIRVLLDNQQITEEIKKEIKICIETNENENTTTQNLWDSVKAVLRGRFIAIQAYLKKQEKNQTSNLTLHKKQLEKEEMKNPRVSRRKEI